MFSQSRKYYEEFGLDSLSSPRAYFKTKQKSPAEITKENIIKNYTLGRDKNNSQELDNINTLVAFAKGKLGP